MELYLLLCWPCGESLGSLDIWGCGLGGEDELQVSIRIDGKYSREGNRRVGSTVVTGVYIS